MGRKIQLPAIGGLRKVIKTGDDKASSINPGTTIAEFANQRITLAQLRAALGLSPSLIGGGGGSGGGGTPDAAIVPGPGLSGGGMVIGAVPINLIAPIPAFVFDEGGGGGDGEPGPPGIGLNGATGQQGPIGPAVQLIPDDGEDGWHAIPGSPGTPGPTGQAGGNGPAVFMSADDGEDGWHAIPGNPGLTGPEGKVGPAIGFVDMNDTPDIPVYVAPPDQLRITNKGANWSSATLTAGIANLVFVNCPVSGTIMRVKVITASNPGSCVIDVWKAPFGSFPPTVANSITAAAKPTISGGTTYEDATLTGWNRSINAGDVLAFKLESVATFTQVQIVLEVLQWQR